MPSIADLRSALGAFANDKNDEQLLQLASTAAGVSPGRIASEYGYKPTASGIAGLRTGASIDRYQAGLYGLGEAITGADVFRRGREANEFEANVASERARAQGAIESFEDVKGISDLPSYVGGLAIGSAPYMAEALGGGLAARGLMSGTRAALGTARAAGDVNAAAQATRALRTGQTLGGVAAGYPSAVGDILQAQREQADGQINLGAAAALGVPYSALNALGLEGALARQQGFRSGIRALDDLSGLRGGAARVAATGLTTGLVEGGTETLQEMTSQLGRMAVDPNEQFFSDAALGRYKESAIGGAFLGGTIGAVAGGGRRSEGYQPPTQERDLTLTAEPITPTNPNQFIELPNGRIINIGQAGQQDVGLKKFVDETTGVIRPSRKGYEDQFKAAFNEPSGQFVADPATGVERELTAGELVQRNGSVMDLTQGKPAETAAATITAAKVATARDPKDIFIRDTLKVIPNQYSRQLFDMMAESGIDPQSELMVPVWNYAAQKYMAKGRYEKAVQLMDEAIINARKGVPSGTTVSTGSGVSAGVGTGGAVVPGVVGTAGSASPVQGTVGGTTPGTGAPVQQAGILPDTSGQPSTTVTTAPTDLTTPPASTSKFRRAPKPMTVLEAAEAAKGSQTGTRKQAVLARGSVTPDVVGALSNDQLTAELSNVNISDAEYALLQNEQARRDSANVAAAEPDIISQIFGEQDAGIVRDFLIGKSSTKIAAELKAAGVKGRGEQMIRNKIAGERAVREEWPKKIAAAKAKYGYTDAQIQQAIKASLAPDADTRSEVERELNLGRADIYGVRLNETEAMEAGLEGSVKSAGGGSSAVKGFTKLQKNIDAMYKRLETEKEPLVLAYISHRLTELQKQVEVFEDKEQAKIRETAGLGDTDGEVDLVAAAKEAEPESISVNNADEAKKAEAEKLRAKAAAKRAADRKGFEVGDTVVNPKLGTGIVRSFSGDGDATTVTVDFQSGQTKELSVQMAKLEKTNAVQVTSTALVPVQSETKGGKGVGGQVRRAEKPASKGQTQGQAKEQIDRGKALWESLSAKTPGLVPYEQLNKLEQDYLTDLAVRTNGKPVVAKEMGLQQLLTKEPITIEGETRIIDEQVTQQVAALPAPQIDRLEKHYGEKRDSAEFLRKVQEDITKYVTQGAEAVAGAIRSIIKAMAEGVLAMGIVFNPNITKDAFTLNVEKTFQQTIEVTQAVPAAAKAQMSPTAQSVYEAMAPVAMKSGKWFMVADKPNGMLHIFKEDGSHALSDPTLYGKDTGDVMEALSSLEGGAKVTPAGKFTLKARPSTYAGGQELILVESKDYTGYIAIHAADTSTPSENRLGRLDTPTAADNRVSYGCINTKHDTFINEIAPNIANLDGGMVFVVPDAQEQAAQMFAAETRTETRTEGGQGAKGKSAATLVGKEETIDVAVNRVLRLTKGDTVEVTAGTLKFDGQITDEASLRRFPGVESALSHYENNDLRQVIDDVELWMVAPDTVDFDAAIMMVDGKQTLAVRSGMLVNSDAANWAIHHELGHIADAAFTTGGIFSGLPEFNLTIQKGVIKPMGSVVSEIMTHMAQNPDSDFTRSMGYPLDHTRNDTKNMSADETRMEVFAQLWAFYNTREGNAYLADNLPATYDFMEASDETAKQNKGGADAQTGAATTAESSQVQAYRGTQRITSAVPYGNAPDSLMGMGKAPKSYEESKYKKEITVKVTFPGDAPFTDGMRGLNVSHALERARRNWDGAKIDLVSATAFQPAILRMARPTQGTIQRNIAKLPKASQSPVRNIVRALGDLGGAGLDYVVFTSDLIKRAVDAGLTSAQTFADALAQRKARVSEFEREIESIADGYADIEPEFKGAGRGSVNDFLFESTRTLKWGYGKYRDDKMGDAFDKLGPKAQKFVKNVFAHGDKILSQKKQSVLKSANSEYDAMIQAAQNMVNTATDAKEKQKAEGELAALKAEKVATLKRFQTLFAIREGKPYAPIKRDGAYVVIGKSAEYKAAEAAKDRKRIKQLESDPDHYHVSFVDTKWAARTLSDGLAEQGVFEDADIVKRSEAFEEAFSGEALLPALTKIRAAVDKRDDSSRSKLLNIVNQLYLEALAEGSARKSEMRRRGVAGEVDMLQSFTRQGRADANFLANVEFEPLIQDALQQMRNDRRGGNRERKSEIFDELTKRYVESLETKGNGFITGLTNTASKYFLASSPAYYMQNLTQPFMMSLPALAGRHDYTKAGKALFDAYAELGPLFKDIKLFDQQFDFSKVPADVRAAITKLVNQGQIDIGLATEINEYKVDADSKLGKFAQRLNKSMRLAVQKVEATNRLSTAIAAYRLEFARTKDAEKATQYAADILTDTHGDYTAMNAPRVFNSQWGKVALQFRKFQLIQIAFYAKLMRDAFTNPAERAVAMRTLAFSLGHTAVFAGMMGLPGYAAIAAILGFFGDEDEPYDLTADMRQALGPEWADLVMRGAPTLVGVDLSGKIGAGNMLSIMPFSDADLSTTAGRAEAFGTLVGGASLGMVSRVADGMGLILSGDYYKGIERSMPKGVSDALKAGRQAAEGMTRRNGDVVLPADEINAISAVLTGLGVPSVKETVVYEKQNRMRDLTNNFQDRTTRIKNDYAKAVRENDGEAKQEAREAWQKLQRTRQQNGLKPQPLSNLLKAPQEQREREKQTVGGVTYRQGQRKLAESVAEN